MKKAVKIGLLSGAAIGTVGVLTGWNALIGNEVVSYSEVESSHESRFVNEEIEGLKAYEIDPTHAGVLFKIRHKGVANFYGQFSTVQGMINLDEDNFENSKIEASVQTKSIFSGDRTRDGHVKGADFLNTRQFSTSEFISKKIVKTGEGRYAVSGDFTLQGVTKEVTIDVSDVTVKTVNGADMMGFEGTFSIQRSEFNITKYYDASSPEDGALGDRIDLHIFVEAISK